jgi:hypothetical protein
MTLTWSSIWNEHELAMDIQIGMDADINMEMKVGVDMDVDRSWTGI